MKIVLDSCIWSGVYPALEASGHDVVWVGEWQEDPGDEQILTIGHPSFESHRPPVIPGAADRAILEE